MIAVGAMLTVLAPVQRRLGTWQVVGSLVRGLLVGAVAGSLVSVVARVQPFPGSAWLAALVLLAGIAAGLVIGVRRWPDHTRTARTIDQHFALHDRLTTAFELQSSAGPIATLQRIDTGRHLARLNLGKTSGGRMERRELVAAVIAVTVFLSLALTATNPGQGHARILSGDGPRIQRVVRNVVPRIVQRANAGLTVASRHDSAMRNLNLVLRRLRRQLQHASNRADALRAISATQQQLRRIAASLHPIGLVAVAQLNRALSSQVTPRQRAATGTSRQALGAAVQTLNRLAQQIAHMSARQRGALARQLARAANATGNSTLRSALHQAASSLAYKDPQSAAAALRGAATALQRSPAARVAQARANNVGAQLDALKSDVTGLSGQQAENTAGQSPGTGARHGSGWNSRGAGPGQGKGQGTTPGGGSAQSKKSSSGSGKRSSQGQGDGSLLGKGQGSASTTGGAHGSGHVRASSHGRGGRSTSDQGKGKGAGKPPPLATGLGRSTGRGAGKGSATMKGKGTGRGHGTSYGGARGATGHGVSGGRGHTGHQAAGRSSARVYLPGIAGRGPHSVQNGGLNGAPLRGSIVPYQRVLGKYTQTAHAAIDHAALPPSLRLYVRQYFATISR